MLVPCASLAVGAKTSTVVSAETKASNRRDGLGFMAGAFAWITAILFLVFAIASCQVLAGMEFKQDSLLYGRAKTD